MICRKPRCRRTRLLVLYLLGAWTFAFVPAQANADPTTQPAFWEKCVDALSPWESKIKSEQLSTLISPPFVLVGDADRGVLQANLDGTIRSSSRALGAMYFKQQPTEPIVIFLFQTGDRYQRLSKDWFHVDDPPHYGYCRSDGVMVMNISTGGGTLVHELVHALIKYDFPAAPTWFNEGLASLYEQSSLQPGKITGLKNWRLPALKQAITEQQLRALTELVADKDFYDKQLAGLNYAQARYLLMYLQEKKLLVKFYADFRDSAPQDASGIETLKKIIAPQTLEEFEKDWREWVEGL